jgi:ribonuclease R
MFVSDEIFGKFTPNQSFATGFLDFMETCSSSFLETSVPESESLQARILEAIRQPNAPPLKPKALARKLRVKQDEYEDFKNILKKLIARGDLQHDRKHGLRTGGPRSEIVGIFKGIRSGGGIVKSSPGQGKAPVEVFIKPHLAKDAVTGDTVRVSLGRRPAREKLPNGKVIEIVERASVEFVGTLEAKGDEFFVRLDGTAIPEPVYIADPTAKNAKAGDKVVVEMLRFPSPQHFAEAVIVEVLGKAGEANVDLLSIIRQFKLSDEFPVEVMKEAREQAAAFEATPSWPSRLDLTGETIITIDPVDAKDFDDAISLSQTEKGHWRLGIHIADVASFVPEGSAIDREARKRGTSVYLPGKVLPMIPETISNGLASLQQDRKRLTKTVFVEIDRLGRILHTEFANSVIQVKKRFTYEMVQTHFNEVDEAAKTPDEPAPSPDFGSELATLLGKMRELADLMRRKRRRKGMLEMSMPEAELEYDAEGRITGCHYHHQTESQRLIEEFMLTANEAVAEKLTDAGILFLRRIHPHPDPLKLKAFSLFAKSLGLKIENEQSRFDLQKVLQDTLGDPRQPAVHFALLRSLKEATYGPEREGHFALASEHYCHFTSPIRRYPDLDVHRLLDRLIRKGKAGADEQELIKLGEHCSITERRAAKAERELVKVKLLEYMRRRIGETIPMIVTGVEEYGLFCQGEDVPADGLLHVRNLPQDFYNLDRATMTLSGRRQGNSYRLGSRLLCVIHRVDVAGRMLDLRISSDQPRPSPPVSPKSLLAKIPGAKPKRGGKPKLPKRGSGKKSAKRRRK